MLGDVREGLQGNVTNEASIKKGVRVVQSGWGVDITNNEEWM